MNLKGDGGRVRILRRVVTRSVSDKTVQRSRSCLTWEISNTGSILEDLHLCLRSMLSGWKSPAGQTVSITVLDEQMQHLEHRWQQHRAKKHRAAASFPKRKRFFCVCRDTMETIKPLLMGFTLEMLVHHRSTENPNTILNFQYHTKQLRLTFSHPGFKKPHDRPLSMKLALTVK